MRGLTPALAPQPSQTPQTFHFQMPGTLSGQPQLTSTTQKANPLYWFKTAVKMCNGLLNSNCEALRKVLKADLHLHSLAPACWTAQILDGFQGSRHCESIVTLMKQGTPISMQDFTGGSMHRLRGVWRFVKGNSPDDSSLAQPVLRQQLSVQDVSDFLLQHNKTFFFMPELLNLLLGQKLLPNVT
eukprot:783171-Pelagomonas_calceolata.AAC.2